LEVPVSTMATAGEGGPWGMALLAAYMCRKAPGESMEDYLMERVFAGADVKSVQPDKAGGEGFRRFLSRYAAALPAERAAAEIR
ncbi:MAG: ATPase, partial [Oscillospiraceae bacterium]|nr:ATPase [Oscillospiraceae bacterium]